MSCEGSANTVQTKFSQLGSSETLKEYIDRNDGTNMGPVPAFFAAQENPKDSLMTCQYLFEDNKKLSYDADEIGINGTSAGCGFIFDNYLGGKNALHIRKFMTNEKDETVTVQQKLITDPGTGRSYTKLQCKTKQGDAVPCCSNDESTDGHDTKFALILNASKDSFRCVVYDGEVPTYAKGLQKTEPDNFVCLKKMDDVVITHKSFKEDQLCSGIDKFKTAANCRSCPNADAEKYFEQTTVAYSDNFMYKHIVYKPKSPPKDHEDLAFVKQCSTTWDQKIDGDYQNNEVDGVHLEEDKASFKQYFYEDDGYGTGNVKKIVKLAGSAGSVSPIACGSCKPIHIDKFTGTTDADKETAKAYNFWTSKTRDKCVALQGLMCHPTSDAPDEHTCYEEKDMGRCYANQVCKVVGVNKKSDGGNARACYVPVLKDLMQHFVKNPLENPFPSFEP